MDERWCNARHLSSGRHCLHFEVAAVRVAVRVAVRAAVQAAVEAVVRMAAVRVATVRVAAVRVVAVRVAAVQVVVPEAVHPTAQSHHQSVHQRLQEAVPWAQEVPSPAGQMAQLWVAAEATAELATADRCLQ